MQSAAGPGQPVISSCQREAESTRNLGGMRQGGRTGEREERGRSEGLSQHCVHNNCFLHPQNNCEIKIGAISGLQK